MGTLMSNAKAGDAGSYTSDDGYSEITVIYEFKWTSTSNAITIFKNNTIVGTVLLSNEEMSMFKNNLNGG